jgi:cytochrome c5
VINDPDCTAGDASTGFLDRCPDPHASGVIGVRKFVVGSDVLFGIACAACHAGFDPRRPPDDPNHPGWKNIHPTIGNQHLNIAKLFNANLSPHDPRYQVFHTWAPGTVDTTAIESDHINNPGIITPFFNFPDRPFFDVTLNGVPIRAHRAGQGGEDDVGCERSGLRVFFNLGMCAAECMVEHLANGPGGTQTPIDLDQCRADCADFRAAEASVGDMCAFMQTTRPPKLVRAPGGPQFIDYRVVQEGKKVFARTCAQCHSNGQPPPHNVYSDDEIHRAAAIGTNQCRALTTNWTAGHIWEAFSSDNYKARPTGGPGFYRDVPLLGIWATAPFFHNNRLGLYNGDPSVAGRIAAFEDAFDQLLNPWKRNLVGSIQVTTASIRLPLPRPWGTITLPTGTPVALFSNLDPQNPLHNLCLDLIENGGHLYGVSLSPHEKYALREFLKTL